MRIYQGVIEIRDLKSFLQKVPDGCIFIDADYVIDLKTVEFAVKKAIRSWENGKRISKNIAMETLLHFSGTRQINHAVKAGLKEGFNRIVVVDLNSCKKFLEMQGFRESEVLKIDQEKLKKIAQFYGISNEEIEITGWEKLNLLVREKIALFSVSK